MEFLSAEMLWGVLTVILIDLVLAGDNAIVIAMAVKNLPAGYQKKAIYWGTAGAIVVRVAATAFVCQLLKIPALMFCGGILLIWIAYKLLTDKKEPKKVTAEGSLGAAVRTIIIADGIMGVDNVMGIAGTAQGNLTLVAFGLMLSIPLVVWGSSILVRLLNRFPLILYIGGGVLAWSAGVMMVSEPWVKAGLQSLPYAKWLIPAIITAVVVLAGWRANRLPDESIGQSA